MSNIREPIKKSSIEKKNKIIEKITKLKEAKFASFFFKKIPLFGIIIDVVK